MKKIFCCLIVQKEENFKIASWLEGFCHDERLALKSLQLSGIKKSSKRAAILKTIQNLISGKTKTEEKSDVCGLNCKNTY